ncbi:MAG TPA: coagulation factor 5/8 type domain-containing protein [Thermoleophilaceae bacterium]|nr:coagulation factor 5/8 type domain-containing protein [Thermoleophilaceae bacterium]
MLKLRSTVVLSLLVALTLGASTASARPPARGASDFGPNVFVFDPSMPVADIQAKADAIYAQQVDNEMGTNRYALLFKPGTYGTDAHPLLLKVGYYTEVAGLGASPDDTVINGKVDVYNRCSVDNTGATRCDALDNFWRTLSNLSIHVNGTGQDGCTASADFWAVSQAAPIRRVDISGGNLSLQHYCTAGPQFASGGFIADSKLPFVINGSQQQWLTRNSEIGGWSNAVWNQVFSGDVGAPDDAGFPSPPYTTLATTPISREKPFLFVDQDGNYNVRVPSAQTGSSDVSWSGGTTAGRTIPLHDFLVATPSTPWHEINSALARGMNLLLTPGVYDVSRSISVKRAHSVVLGLGLATLTAENGTVPLKVADVPGVVIAGVTVDAGPVESPVLLRVGKRQGHVNPKKSDASDPTTLSDVYFRVGGAHIGKADTALEVNSDHVLIDNAWIWRADHGVENLSDTERWNTNIGRNGLVVNGDDVTATGLFVEHFQQYNTVWKGENGTTIMYQSELAYDPPSQADWMHDGVNGWAGYKVGDQVKTHHLYGGGVYVFNRNNPSIHTENGFEVPTTPGVQLHHIMTVNLNAGTIDHVVDGVGGPADTSRVGVPVYVVDYP